jgi:hypothetical protein
MESCCWFFFWVVYLEEVSEIRAASGEHHLVSGERFTVAGQRDVDKVFDVAQMAERGKNRRLEVVPPQTVQLMLLLLLLLLLLLQLVVLRMERLLFGQLLLRLATRVDYRVVFHVGVHISVVVVIFIVVFLFVLVVFLVVLAVVATVGPLRTPARREPMLGCPLLAVPATLGRRVGRHSASLIDGMLLLLLLRVGQQIGGFIWRSASAGRRMLSDAGLFHDAGRHRH